MIKYLERINKYKDKKVKSYLVGNSIFSIQHKDESESSSEKHLPPEEWSEKLKIFKTNRRYTI